MVMTVPPPPGPLCTGITASWCPHHGDCTCQADDLNSPTCPLHASDSSHGEPHNG